MLVAWGTLPFGFSGGDKGFQFGIDGNFRCGHHAAYGGVAGVS